jgi:hypothetical protein
MTRTELINYLIAKHGYTSYLEIGIYDGINFSHIKCRVKVGVDPDRKTRATIKKTSDEFFRVNRQKFDLIFIDGLHYAQQVIRDINNSLGAISEGGTIVVHDCNPTTYEMQAVPRTQGIWTGDVWRAWVYMRRRSDLSMYVIDTDYGCGIIRRGKQNPVIIDDPEWEDFVEHKKEWPNLITLSEFLQPKLSVCIPAFEQYGFGKKRLVELLGSLKKQHGSFEIIVSDNSHELKEVCDNSQMDIKYFHNPSRGVSNNTNFAISRASHDFIKLMYQDDLLFSPDALLLFQAALEHNGWAACQYWAINEHDQKLKLCTPRWNKNILTSNNTIGMPSVMAFRKNEFLFDTNLKTRLDIEYYWQLNKEFGEPYVINKPLVACRYWNGSTSKKQGNFSVIENEYLREKYQE